MKKLVVGVLTTVFFTISQSTMAQHTHGSGGATFCADYNAAVPKTAKSTQRDGFWSDPNTWGGQVPNSLDNVVINHSITMDQGQGKEIQIQGHLNLAGQLDAYGSLLVCNGGLITGAAGTVNFHIDDDRNFVSNAAPGPVPSVPAFQSEDTGLWVFSGGTVHLEAPTVTSWLDADSINNVFSNFKYNISKSVAFANGVAKLSGNPVGWQVGDQLLLVTEMGEHSLASLTSINGSNIGYLAEKNVTGNVLRIDGNFVKPKIANLSRRLQFVSADVVEGDTNHRAHSIFLAGSHVTIKAVEFRNLGPRGKLGRYPLHWHHAGSTHDILEGSSIWQDVDDGGNRFMSLHIVQGATVSNNVGFRSQGHGYFMEEIAEFNNTMTGNLSVDVRHGEELSNVNDSISTKTQHFWVRQSNVISGNVAAGVDWDMTGRGNQFPALEGIVLLPSTKADANPLVTDFECLGCGGVGMWTAVPNTKFVNPVSVNALVAGYSTYSGINWDLGEAEIVNPIMLLNGNNDLFAKTNDYLSRTPFGSQVYGNYNEVVITGGILAGKLGIHAHYDPKFTMNGTTVYSDYFLEPTYWDFSGNVSNSRIFSTHMFTNFYPNVKQMSPGLLEISNTCFGSDCASPAGALNVTVTREIFTHLFESQVNSKFPTVFTITEPVNDSGFVRIPGNLNARYWSIVPADSQLEPKILFISENEVKWGKNLARYGGYIDGYPQGIYEVKLYSGATEDTLVASGTVDVKSGLVSNICLDNEVCEQNDSPTLVITSPRVSNMPSGTIAKFTGYANDEWDGILTNQISWSSNRDGLLGTGSNFDFLLSDGSHTITANVTDSDSKQSTATFRLNVGNFSTPATTTSAPLPKLSDGVGIFMANAACQNGQDPHWQCHGTWVDATAITEDSFVSYCPVGVSSYLECMGDDLWKRFGDLNSSDTVGACVGIAITGGGRGDCANSLGSQGHGVHSYVHISEIWVGAVTDSAENSEDVDAAESVPDLPDPIDQQEVSLPSETTSEEGPNDGSGEVGGESSGGSGQANDSQQPQIISLQTQSNTAVFLASGACKNGMDPHWQCEGRWASPESVKADNFVAYCPKGASSYIACLNDDSWRRFGDLALTDSIVVCSGVALTSGLRNDCANSIGPEGFGDHRYVPVSIIFPQPTITVLASSVVSPEIEAADANEADQEESTTTEHSSAPIGDIAFSALDEESLVESPSDEPVSDPVSENTDPSETVTDLVNGDDESGVAESESDEGINSGAEETTTAIFEPEILLPESEPESASDTIVQENDGEENSESSNSDESSDAVNVDIAITDESSSDSKIDINETENDVSHVAEDTNEPSEAIPPHSSNEPTLASDDGSEDDSDSSESTGITEAEVASNEGAGDESSEETSESIADTTDDISEQDDIPANETQTVENVVIAETDDTQASDHEETVSDESLVETDEPATPPAVSEGETGNDDLDEELIESIDAEVAVAEEIEEEILSTQDDSPNPANDNSTTVVDTEENIETESSEPSQEVDLVEETVASNSNTGGIVDIATSETCQSDTTTWTGKIINGPTKFNSGTMKNFVNSGAIIGGNLEGSINNINGMLIDVELKENAVVTGGIILGSLTGTGRVENLLLDISHLDSRIKLGYRTRFTSKAVQKLTGIELTNALVNPCGFLDNDFKFLIAKNQQQLSLIELIKESINNYYGDSSTYIEQITSDGVLAIANDNLETIVTLIPDSVIATNEKSGILVNENGRHVIVNRGLAITVIEVLID